MYWPEHKNEKMTHVHYWQTSRKKHVIQVGGRRTGSTAASRYMNSSASFRLPSLILVVYGISSVSVRLLDCNRPPSTYCPVYMGWFYMCRGATTYSASLCSSTHLSLYAGRLPWFTMEDELPLMSPSRWVGKVGAWTSLHLIG